MGVLVAVAIWTVSKGLMSISCGITSVGSKHMHCFVLRSGCLISAWSLSSDMLFASAESPVHTVSSRCWSVLFVGFAYWPALCYALSPVEVRLSCCVDLCKCCCSLAWHLHGTAYGIVCTAAVAVLITI
jgi:hypothetical protein